MALIRPPENSMSTLAGGKVEVSHDEKRLDKRLQYDLAYAQIDEYKSVCIVFFLGVGCLGLSVASRTEFATRRIASEKLGQNVD